MNQFLKMIYCILKVGQNKHHLSHHFDTHNGVNMMVGESKPGIGGIPLAGQDLRPKNSNYPKGIKDLVLNKVHFQFS